MSQYKAVFSDIDGTLLNDTHKITPKTAQSIKRIVQHGIPFIPVSARPPKAITPYTGQLETDNAIICYSGALILDKNLTALYSIEIDETSFQTLEKILQNYTALSINYYAGLDWFANDTENYWVKQEHDITGVICQPKPPHLTHVHKILVMAEPEQILQVEPILKAELSHLSIHRSKPTYLEIMNKQATKAKAIQFMERHLNVTADEVIAFGDNYNDLDMLQYAGLSVAMANSPDDVKAVAKEVTASNNEDGIALVLNRIFAE
ncbi:hypothetical protein EDC44_1219 [Cricetibacter osteomyelitidis]|uniref:Cof subfamily protein (Haloacid dehalogenase superfamily)/HAD superfamily hydrolase (TIGR01484 family) n=1 Tax=Cricetibacter osteomyelitidis TaxID=1521931 RepID=A0A4R2T7Z9_9PAST|nr:Cof-type HAD-IIB family hydrolase [Cricetibacter osteomyelitidis]TCP93298.1 hypothetical protein EDC44_1219 [Cricetibacter osteomyelitidis]